jgi:hypothetical protein
MAADRMTRRAKRTGSRTQPARDEVHPFVLDVLKAVHRATAGRRQPFYVSLADLGLPPDLERFNAAVMLASFSGWLQAGGDPPHSVSLTAEGLALLERRGVLEGRA